MTDRPPEPIELKYCKWEWDTLRKCWYFDVPIRIYPLDGGEFAVSSHDVWHEGVFATMQDAEDELFHVEPKTGE